MQNKNKLETKDLYCEMYCRMQRIRQFEAKAVRLAKRGEITGALHTATGQEGEIVGACMALSEDDYMVGNHRSHGHPIGKGASLNGLMAELFGKIGGVNRGKGGSMHLADFSVGSLGETSIVGSGLPVAAGAALGAKYLKNGRVSLCFFGDGASNEGTFHESLNLAAIWKLPAIFLCENNGYAISTAAKNVVSVPDIADRAVAYSIPGEVVDGQDVLAVFNVVSAAVDRARRGDGPALVEAKTYRYNEHESGLKTLNYRTEEEINRWQERDPITLFKQWLMKEGVASEEQLQQLEKDVEAEVSEAIEFARTSPAPDKIEAFDHVFVNPNIPID